MNKHFFKIAILLLFFCMYENVYALDTCPAKDKVELSSVASRVKVNREIQMKEDGTPYFVFNIYNLTDKIYIKMSVKKDGTDSLVKPAEFINSMMSDAGTYTFTDDNITEVYNYELQVFAGTEECTQELRTIKTNKPMRNKYHDYDECKYDETETNMYCKEWIDKAFNLDEFEILKRIETSKSAGRITTTTATTKVVRDNSNKKMHMLKLIAVGMISFFIVLLILYLYIRVDNIRRSSL